MLNRLPLSIRIVIVLIAAAPLQPVVAASESPACRLLAASIRAETDAGKRQAKQKQYGVRCRQIASIPKPAGVQERSARDTAKKKPSAGTLSAAKKDRPGSKASGPKSVRKQKRPTAPRRQKRAAPPGVVTVPIYGSVIEAIERVADGGTVWVPAGSYISPQVIYKRVRIFGMSDSNGNKPVLLGTMKINTFGVEIDGFEIRKGAFESEVNLTLITVNYGSSISLTNVNLNADSCVRDGNFYDGAILATGTVSLKYAKVMAGRCYALAVLRGNVNASDTTFTSTDEFAIVQSAGSSYFDKVDITGISALHIQDKAEMTLTNSTITTRRGYTWWSRGGEDSHLYTGGNTLRVN